MDISQFGKGAIKDKLDLRDYRYKPSIKASILPEEFSLRDKIIAVKNQDGSSSCVSQAFSYYAEVLNFIETGNKVQLSPREIYSIVFLPEGGSSLRDNAKKLCNSGVALEADVSSYENGNPPGELFMRKRDDVTEKEKEIAMTFVGKEFKTWNDNKFDTYKSAIFENYGCVAAGWGNNYCWKNSILEVPDTKGQCDWAHGIYCIGWKKINGVECLEFVNSWGKDWGDNGFGFIPRSYIENGLFFNPITYTDRPNSWYANQLKYIDILKNLIEKLTEWIRSKKQYGTP